MSLSRDHTPGARGARPGPPRREARCGHVGPCSPGDVRARSTASKPACTCPVEEEGLVLGKGMAVVLQHEEVVLQDLGVGGVEVGDVDLPTGQSPVGDHEEHCRAGRGGARSEVALQLGPGDGVEGPERLVEQENLGLEHQRAHQADALACPRRALHRPRGSLRVAGPRPAAVTACCGDACPGAERRGEAPRRCRRPRAHLAAGDCRRAGGAPRPRRFTCSCLGTPRGVTVSNGAGKRLPAGPPAWVAGATIRAHGGPRR